MISFASTYYTFSNAYLRFSVFSPVREEKYSCHDLWLNPRTLLPCARWDINTHYYTQRDFTYKPFDESINFEVQELISGASNLFIIRKNLRMVITCNSYDDHSNIIRSWNIITIFKPATANEQFALEETQNCKLWKVNCHAYTRRALVGVFIVPRIVPIFLSSRDLHYFNRI